MSEFQPSPEFEEKMRAAVSTPAPRAAFVNHLRANLREKAVMNTPQKRWIFRPVWAVALALFVALLLTGFVIGPQRVAAAIQSWFGYIPGIGLVHEGEMRVLAQPVSVTQGNFVLTVEKAILSAEKTYLKYTIKGLSSALRSNSNMCDSFVQQPTLRLPDAHTLALQQGGPISRSQNLRDYDGEITYAGMPANVNQATLTIPCIAYTDPAKVPQTWELPLSFAPAPPNMVVPMVEVPATAQPSAQPSDLTVKNIIPTVDENFQHNYILAGLFKANMPDGYVLDTNDNNRYFDDASVTDVNGQPVDFSQAPFDFSLYDLFEESDYPAIWAGQINSVNPLQSPLTLTVHSVPARGPDYPAATFQFDAGTNPQVGQTWMLNQDVGLGPKTIHVISVKLIMHEADFAYEFTFSPDPTVDLSVLLLEHQANGWGFNNGEPFTRTLSFPNAAPNGILKVSLGGHDIIKVTGPWKVSLTLPENQPKTEPTPGSATATPAGPLTDETPIPMAVSLTLDGAEPSKDGYLIHVSYHYASADIENLMMIYPEAIQLFDPENKEIALKDQSNGMYQTHDTELPSNEKFSTIPFQTAGLYKPGTYTLKMNSLYITRQARVQFSFDAGPNPQPGQTWTLNQPLNVGGYTLKLLTAQYTAAEPGRHKLEFEVEASPETLYAEIVDMDSGQTSENETNGTRFFKINMDYPAELTGGTYRFQVNTITTRITGPWTASWTPPTLTAGQPTPEPFACITRTSWQAALAAQAPIPAGLTGKLVSGGPANRVGKFQFQVVGLDGSGSKDIFPGFGMLAPDGVHLANTTDTGISIINLASNQTSALPGTTDADFGPIWTSDSSEIAFQRNRAGDGGIYVAGVDGSNLRRIIPSEPDSGNLIALVGWLPNTDTLIYTTSNLMTSPDSAPMKTSFHQFNLQTSQDTLLFTTDGFAFNPALSPDGKQLAFSETEATGNNKKFFHLSDLDGSNRKLLSNGDLFIFNPVWSPDGKWIAFNLGEYITNETPALMLFNPQTCELIPLPGLTDSVSSWAP